MRKENPRASANRLMVHAKEEWHRTYGVQLRVEGGNVKPCRGCGHAPEAVEIAATRNASGYWRLSCPTRRCREKWAARGADYLAAVTCWNEKQEVPHD